MEPIASRLLLVFALSGGYVATARADAMSSKAQLQISNAALPAFVPKAGQGNYASAVTTSKSSAAAARDAAEALSAKFSDITTGSISKDDTALAVQKSPRPASAQGAEGRSIVLAVSKAVDDPKREKSPTSPSRRAKTPETADRIPRSIVRKAAAPRGSIPTIASLTSIGQKVGLLDLLTNPALWH